MAKGLAYTLLLVLILVLFYILYLIFIYRLSFNFKLKNIDPSTLNLSDLLQTGQTKAKIQVEADIMNGNPIGVSFSNINVWFYSNANLIAKTSSDVPTNFENMYLPAYGVFSHIDTLDLFVSPTTVKLFADIKKGNSQKIDYYVQGKIFGFIPFSYNNTFNT